MDQAWFEQVGRREEHEAWVAAYQAQEQRQENEMGRFAKDTGGEEFPQAPTGTHVARCFRIIDLGTQHGEYQGQPNVRSQVLVSWELPAELMDDGKPFAVSFFYTNSLGEKANLRHHLEAWRGKQFTPDELEGFDLMNILGVPCMVTVTANEKGKAKVTSVSGLPKGFKCPPQVNPSTAFWMEEWSDEEFAKIPKGIQEIMKKSDEYREMIGELAPKKPVNTPAHAFADMEDEVPF